MACAALALDLGLLGSYHRELQAGADAASLAGGAELMDDAVLYPHLRRLERYERPRPADRRDLARFERVRKAAAHHAAQNRAMGRPIKLDLNGKNDPRGDLVIGWVADPTDLESPLVPVQKAGRANSLAVQISKTRERGNPVSLLVADGLGMKGVDLNVLARATIDQRVAGFEPAGHVNVPLAPVAIEPRGRSGWFRQVVRPAGGDNDRYRVDYRTGAIAGGGDRIPEVTLRLSPRRQAGHDEDNHDDRRDKGKGRRPDKDIRHGGDDDRDDGNRDDHDADRDADRRRRTSARWVRVSREPPPAEHLAELFRRGYDRRDLAEAGGRVHVGQRLIAYQGREHRPGQWREQLRRALLGIRGEKRVWPLVIDYAVKNEPRGGEGDFAWVVTTGYVAAVVVDCQFDGDGLLITLQPCLLQTSTAITGKGETGNPWIGKLVLTR